MPANSQISQTDDNVKATFEWKSHEILLLKDGNFLISIQDKASTFKSLDEARTALDKADARLAKVKREKLCLAVIDDNLQPHIITGLHATTERLLLAPALVSNWNDDNVYCDAPSVRDIVAERNDLRSKLKEVQSQLSNFRIDADWKWSRRSFDESLEELKKQYARKLALTAKEPTNG